jgi:hypothetical protein
MPHFRRIAVTAHTALSGVSCTGAGACMAVGYYGYNNGTGTKVTLAESWNGAAWQRRDTPTPGASGGLAGVSCVTASACRAAGGHAEPAGNLGNATLAEQWGGRHWRVQPTPNPAGAGAAGFDAVSCTSSSRCMATGAALDQTGESQFTLAQAWNGTAWSVVKTPRP